MEQDEERTEFIKSHLIQLARAIEEGAKVFGYLYWSLLGNYEWAEGFSLRFGLIEVNYETQERKIRPSAKRFAQLCERATLGTESDEPVAQKVTRP